MQFVVIANQRFPVQHFDHVSDIDGEKDNYNIKVKILLVWRQYYRNNPTVVASLETILIDEKGDKIQASIKKVLIPDYEDKLEEGAFIELSNFGTGGNMGNYVLVDHKHRINFYKSTKVKISQPFEGDKDGLSLVQFDDINSWKVNQKIAFDLVGHLVRIDDLRVRYEGGKQSKYLTFELQDLSGTKIDCCLWDDFATQMYTTVNDNDSYGGPIVILIQLAKVKNWQGKPQISNSLFGTRLYINSDIPAVQSYKFSLLAKDGGSKLPLIPPVFSPTTIVTKPQDYYGQFRVKTIDEVRELDEPIGCVILATVIRIQKDMGWYYNACRKCGKKVDRNELVNETTKLYDCAECGEVDDVYGRIRVQLRVQDNTGSTSVVLFERHVTRLINRSASFLMSRMRNHDEEQVFPDDFDVLLEKLFVFKIQISEFNLENNYSAYTVHRLTDDEGVVRCIREKLIANEVDNAPLDVPAQGNVNNVEHIEIDVDKDNVAPRIGETNDVAYVDTTPADAIIKRKAYDVVDCETSHVNTSKVPIFRTQGRVEGLKIPKMEKL